MAKQAPMLRVQPYNKPRLYRVVSGRGRSFKIHADGFASEEAAREFAAKLEIRREEQAAAEHFAKVDAAHDARSEADFIAFQSR